jgi:hypothetical protein
MLGDGDLFAGLDALQELGEMGFCLKGANSDGHGTSLIN